MFVLYVRVRRYTLTVDDRREMGGDEASHTSTDHQRDENWKKISSFIHFDHVMRQTNDVFYLTPRCLQG